MLFKKNILIVDFETTGLDIATLEPIEIGAILLSGDDLTEIDRYTEHILASRPLSASAEALAISGKTYADIVTRGKTPLKIVRDFDERFFKAETDRFDSVYLAAWNAGFDIPILKKLYANVGVNVIDAPKEKTRFDHHVLELWSMVLSCKLLAGVSVDGLLGMQHALRFFGVDEPYSVPHRAIHDCEIAAKILRLMATVGE